MVTSCGFLRFIPVTSRSQLALYSFASPQQQLRTHLRGHREGELMLRQTFFVMSGTNFLWM